MKTYDELITLKSFEERLEYLRLFGRVGEETFGSRRWLNQMLYRSKEWKDFKRRVAFRDGGYDLGMEGYVIAGPIYIHHIEPVTTDDIINRSELLFDMNNVISTSFDTHQRIHYDTCDIIRPTFIERTPFDTCPWKTAKGENL